MTPLPALSEVPSVYLFCLSFHRAEPEAPCLQHLMAPSLTSLLAILCKQQGMWPVLYTRTRAHTESLKHTHRGTHTGTLTHRHTHAHPKSSFTCGIKTPIPNISCMPCVVSSCWPYQPFLFIFYIPDIATPFLFPP